MLLVEGWGVHASSCVRETERQGSDRDISTGCWWGHSGDRSNIRTGVIRKQLKNVKREVKIN